METNKELFINRELSWLEFNRRVLDLSRGKAVPLAEQLNFAAIYGSNLDEFFMVRVGSLYDQTLLKNETRENKTGMTAKQQIAAIMPKVEELQRHCDKDVARLFDKLREYSLCRVDFNALNKEKEALWKKYFQRELFPVLSPQIIDRRHPFPFLRDREIYLGAIIEEGKNNNRLFGLIPVNAQFERLIMVNEGEETHFALVEELILKYAELAFGKVTVLEKCLFRVTRNADINVEEGMFDHDIDYRVVMSELLKKRRKLAAVRLQFHHQPSKEFQEYLQHKLLLPAPQCAAQNAPLELSVLRKLIKRLEGLGRPELFYPVARPLPPPSGYDLYREVQQRDVLIHYPYQSMRPFIRMLFQAAQDPDVVSIKMTLYRVAADSQVIAALITAAENGKEVVTIVELRARFDEQNNIDWSRQLEQAGCTVIYGFSDYKVHSKLLLITRKVGSRFAYVSQIGTGNYNEKTSELYTDLSYITSKPEIGEEVGAVFNNLALERLTENVTHLIVAPLRFKSVLLGEIRREIEFQQAGGDARVILKCNSISDKDIIETLSDASGAGVPIDMIIRGICCLQAGLPGLSEHIRVRSIVGRYLEHSRIYSFGKGTRLRIYIASGDFLTRNTERRVEVGVRIEDPAILQTLSDILEMQLQDNVNARNMLPSGKFARPSRKEEEPARDCQMEMYGYLQRQLAQSLKPTAVSPAPSEPETQTESPQEKPSPAEMAAVIPPQPKPSLWRRIRRIFRRPPSERRQRP